MLYIFQLFLLKKNNGSYFISKKKKKKKKINLYKYVLQKELNFIILFNKY